MKIKIENDGVWEEVELYSQKGLELTASLWTKLCTQYKLTHETSWMGIPIIQLPEDVLMMQELVWKVRPDVIVECGVAHGGAALFYASLMELIGKGTVVGVDIEIRKYNRVAIQSHSMSHRVHLIEGSSTDPEIVAQVRNYTKHAKTVMVILDSNHSKDYVAKEIEAYKELVTPGSYLVVMDGAQAYVADIPNGKPEWSEDNPLAAINDFMLGNKEFVIDEFYTRLLVTANPKGFLRKLSQEERAQV